MSATISACENVCRDFSWIGPILSALGELGSFLVGISAVFAAYGAFNWWQQRRSEAQAKYMLDAFEALTDFSIFLHKPSLKEALGEDRLQVAVNRALNNVQMFGSSVVVRKAKELGALDGSEQSAQRRKELVEELRTLLRDTYRAELRLEPLSESLNWDYWNFRGASK
ncbi:MAG: hypothetical protein KDJ82_08215 [Rhodobacteraceae bacterium]|nr:hypothetical protein [Paracoccaceae bacterium]